MAEPEDIGGISVSVAADNSQLPADLTAALRQMEEFAGKAQAILNVHVRATAQATSAGTAQVSAVARRVVQSGAQPPIGGRGANVSFGPGGVSTQSEQANLQKMIADAAAAQGIPIGSPTALQAAADEVESQGKQSLLILKDAQSRAAQQRRELEARNPTNALVVNRSEQALFRQRQREETQRQREIDRQVARTEREKDYNYISQEQVEASIIPQVARTELPGRNLSTAGVQLAQAGTRQKQILLEAQYRAALKNTLTAQREYDDAVATGSPKQEEALKRLTGYQHEVTSLGKELKSSSTALANFSQGFIGGIAGATAYGAALSAVQVGISLADKAIGPAIQNALGYITVTNTLTDALSTQTLANNNNVRSTVQLSQAQQNIGANVQALIDPLIQQRTAALAGAKSFGDFIDNYHAFQQIQNQNKGLPGDRSLYQNTTGFLGTSFLGQASTIEQLTNFLNQQPSLQTGTQTGPPNQGLLSGILPGFGGATGGGTTSQADVAKNAAAVAQSLDALTARLRDAGDSTDTFATRTKDNAAQIDASIMALKSSNLPGAQSLAAALQKNNAGIVGPGTLTDILNSLGGGTSAQALQQQLALNRPFNVAAANREQSYQLNAQIPEQGALALLAQPMLKAGTGIAANADEQKQVTAATQQTAAAQAALNALYADGRRQLSQTAEIPPQLLGGITDLGKQIAGIQQNIANEQAGYQTAQYNYQLMIAKRNLSDIGGLVGKNLGAGQSYLGVLEHQNLALSRQGQQLQFALTQRQINFNIAVAGFAAPGLTPAEMAARQDEAKVEAGYAQKQLDIQKQMFGNQVKIVDIGNLRQGTDLIRQIRLLQQGRKVQIDTSLAAQQLDVLQKKQALLVQQAGTYLSKQDKLAAQAMGEIQQLETAAGKALGSLAVTILQQYGIVITGLTNQLNGTGGNGGSTGYKSTYGHHASGALFNTSGAGSMVVGEAGNETVAVLRNPRSMSGGAGSSVNIIFNGLSVRGDADIDAIARKVAGVMGRTASAKGLRPLGN